MTRKRARHLYMELARRVYLDTHGNLKGFGKVAKFYRSDWKPDVAYRGGYKSVWNTPSMLSVRFRYGMFGIRYI